MRPFFRFRRLWRQLPADPQRVRRPERRAGDPLCLNPRRYPANGYRSLRRSLASFAAAPKLRRAVWGYQTSGTTVLLRPSTRSTARVSSVKLTFFTRSPGLISEACIPFLHQIAFVLPEHLLNTPKLHGTKSEVRSEADRSQPELRGLIVAVSVLHHQILPSDWFSNCSSHLTAAAGTMPRPTTRWDIAGSVTTIEPAVKYLRWPRVRPRVADRGENFCWGVNCLLHNTRLSLLPRAFVWRLLQGRLVYRSTAGWVRRPRPGSCRASSTTCMAGSGGNPLASPPRFPDGRAA